MSDLIRGLAPIAAMIGVGAATGNFQAAMTAKSAAEGFVRAREAKVKPFSSLDPVRAKSIGEMDLGSRQATFRQQPLNEIQRIMQQSQRGSQSLTNLYQNAKSQEIIDLFSKFSTVPMTAEGGKAQPVAMTNIRT
tara:strand:+ start:1408 stop:1812 length:405 start_codon:yes stop_codon:yes gene_type:complete